MTIILQHRRGPTSESNALTGAEGELFVDLDKNTVVVHDGATQGGYPLPTFTDLTSSAIDQYSRTTANGANGLAAGAYAAANTKYSTNGGTINGSVTIAGNLNVTGNTIISKNVEADIVIVDTTLYSGLASRSSVVLPNLIAQFASNAASYIQVNSQNINPEGSADYVVTADNGTDTDFYIDLGLHGSQAYDKMLTPYDGYLFVQGSTINQSGGNLIIGTTSSFAGLQTMFVAGGYESNNVVMKIGTYGANVVGNLTVTGQTHAKVPGPYSSDVAAASAGVKVGEMYYRSTGLVYARLT